MISKALADAIIFGGHFYLSSSFLITFAGSSCNYSLLVLLLLTLQLLSFSSSILLPFSFFTSCCSVFTQIHKLDYNSLVFMPQLQSVIPFVIDRSKRCRFPREITKKKKKINPTTYRCLSVEMSRLTRALRVSQYYLVPVLKPSKLTEFLK